LSLRDLMEDALKGHGADYAEIRVEETDSTRITYRGRNLENIGQTDGRGGNIRAVVNGGWGFACFNRLDDLKKKVGLAVAQARAVGGDGTKLAEVAPHADNEPPVVGRDPASVSVAEKKQQMERYNDLIWSVKGVQSSDIIYGDSRRKIHFASSEGAWIERERVDVICRVSAQARDGGDVQQSGFSVGSAGDFSLVEDLDEQVVAAANRAVAQLSARTLPGGERTVVLDPVLAGVFAHEAFGHLSEADHVYENERLKEIMVLGKRFGPSHLSIVDGAAVPGFRGSYRFDDEGTPGTRTDLIREGVLVGRLHSRETAAKMGEQPTGNARAIGYGFAPIVRMTNTFVEPREASFDDLLEGIEEGVYVKNWYGGQTSMEMFTFSAGEAYMIRNGRVEEMIRPVMLSGNLFTTLENIDAIGNDLEMNQGGGCGKGGQSPLPVSNGSPHIRIRKCLVSGA